MKHKYRKGAAIKPMFELGATLKKYMDGGMMEYENGGIPDRSERITAYADDLSNNYGTTRGFGKALQDYMKVLNYLRQKSDHSAFADEFSSRARNLFDDHFYRTDESASRDVTPESERDESLVDRARVNQFYRDLFQSALSEGGEAADRIFFMQENADKRRLMDEVDKDLSDFKNSPEGKQAAQMAGPMMSLVNQYSNGGTVKYRPGGMMEYPGGGLMPKQYEEGGELDPEKLRKLARSLSVLGSDDRMRENVSATTGGPEGNLSLDVAMNVPEGIESLSMPSPEPEERVDLQRVDVRGPRVIRSNRRNKSIQGGRREVPEMPAKEDYRFIPLRDPAGGGITTVKSGQKSDPSGMMGVRVGNTYYYMPNARGYTGPRGKNVRDFREIRDRFGEDAYMEALGMLQEGGADISQFVN